MTAVKITDEGEGLKEIGEKIFNTVDALVHGIRKDIPPNFRKVLEKYANNMVVGIRLGREPIQKAVKAFINIVTLGDLNRKAKNLNYDDIYHLFSLIKLDNNVILRLEKNHVISLKVVNSYEIKDHLDVSLNNRKITFGNLITNGIERSKENFFVYHAITANCQIFLNNILFANKLNDTKYTKFIMQDAQALISKDSFFGKLSKKVTDLANLADIVEQGRGLNHDIYQEYFRIFMKRPNNKLMEINSVFNELKKSDNKLDDDLYYISLALGDACLEKGVISYDKYHEFNELLDKRY